MVNPANGFAIDGFPATGNVLSALTGIFLFVLPLYHLLTAMAGPALTRILHELGEAENGNIREKQRRLRKAIGLTDTS